MTVFQKIMIILYVLTFMIAVWIMGISTVEASRGAVDTWIKYSEGNDTGGAWGAFWESVGSCFAGGLVMFICFFWMTRVPMWFMKRKCYQNFLDEIHPSGKFAMIVQLLIALIFALFAVKQMLLFITTTLWPKVWEFSKLQFGDFFNWSIRFSIAGMCGFTILMYLIFLLYFAGIYDTIMRVIQAPKG